MANILIIIDLYFWPRFCLRDADMATGSFVSHCFSFAQSGWGCPVRKRFSKEGAVFMDSASSERFKELLMKMRKEILNHMDAIKQEEAETSLRDEDGDNSAIGMHLADQGTDAMSQMQNFIVVEYESRVLYQIDQALEKIENSQFGICEFCGCEIMEKRLEAIPYTALCRKCQEQEEGMYKGSYPGENYSMADEDYRDY